MAITIRPTDDEVKLVEYAKEVTGEKTASKALLKLCEQHRSLESQLDKTQASERHYRSKSHKAETVVKDFQRALSNLSNCGL